MISLYVCHHKPWPVFANAVVRPMQVGRALAGFELRMPGDDTGDNISAKNGVYCELTGLYWAWKNDRDSEWIGLMHYRRLFCFNPAVQPADDNGVIGIAALDEAECRRLCLDPAAIEARIAAHPQAQVFIPARLSVRNSGHRSVAEQFAHSPYHFPRDLQRTREVVGRLFPGDLERFDAVFADRAASFSNMFIMRRPLFEEYCAWLFAIFFELEREIDTTNYCAQARRVFGYLAERLLNVFLHKRLGRAECVELQCAFVKPHAEPCAALHCELRPLPGALPVATASDDAFVPLLGPFLLSVLDSVRGEGGADVIVLDGGISEHNAFLLRRLFRENAPPGSRLTLLDCRGLYHGIPTHLHFSTATFYRLSLGRVLPHYSRILYLDSDTIVLGDLWELWRLDLGGAAAAAAPDIIMRCMARRNVPSIAQTGGVPAREYLERHVLGGGDVEEYFQSGVMLCDLDRLRDLDLEARALADLAQRSYWFMDQDLLNKHLKGRVKYLDTAWNCLNMAGECLEELEDANWTAKVREDMAAPKLIHYAGHLAKPPNNPAAPLAGPFWYYASRAYWQNGQPGGGFIGALPPERPRLLFRLLRSGWRSVPRSLRESLLPLKYRFLLWSNRGRR